jgi:hypothetical protein
MNRSARDSGAGAEALPELASRRGAAVCTEAMASSFQKSTRWSSVGARSSSPYPPRPQSAEGKLVCHAIQPCAIGVSERLSRDRIPAVRLAHRTGRRRVADDDSVATADAAMFRPTTGRVDVRGGEPRYQRTGHAVTLVSISRRLPRQRVAKTRIEALARTPSAWLATVTLSACEAPTPEAIRTAAPAPA